MATSQPSRGYLSTVLSCRCPRCREAKLFRQPVSIRLKKNMDMHKHCPVCNQPTDLEVGFYYGTGYVSYVISLLLSIFFFILWFILIGFSYHDHRFLYWIASNTVMLIVLQPWLMRFSRVLWLSWFVKYDPDWKDHAPGELERVVDSQMNNW